MAGIELREVTKAFTPPRAPAIVAVDQLSLSLSAGERLVLTGPSGCGKTTILRLIAGLEIPSSGRIFLGGEDVTRQRPHERDVAMVFQEPALYPHMTAAENMGFGLRVRHCPAAEIERRVTWAAEMLGIAECLARRPYELSGGQRHRVAVGRALVRRPRVFLFDEPFASLDAPAREQLRQELLSVCEAVGAMTIYVTHDQAEAMVTGTQLAVLDRGRLQQIAPPKKIYRRPANLFVARFIGVPPMNLCNGTLAECGPTQLRFQGAGWSIVLEERLSAALRPYAGRKVVLGARPEDLVPAESTASDQNPEFPVSAIDDLGAELRLHLAVDGQKWIARWPTSTTLAENKVARVQIRPGSLCFFDPVTEQSIP